MRIAVLADIHGNHSALDAACAYMEAHTPDMLLMLGDYITDGPYPERIMDTLYGLMEAYPTAIVRGNREEYVLSHHPDDDWTYSSSSGSLLYTYNHLTERDFAFLRSLPIVQDVTPPVGMPFTICHASPHRSKEWIFGDAHMEKFYLRRIQTRFLLCGHTHQTRHVTYADKSLLYCPSLGLPQDPCSDARMLYLDWNEAEAQYGITYIPLQYDTAALLDDYRNSDFLDATYVWGRCLAKALTQNDRKDYCMQCVTLAWKYAGADHYTPPVGSSQLPEVYWEAAAKQLGI